MIRKRCLRNGHKWATMPPLPVQFCARYGCKGQRVNPGYPMPTELRDMLERRVNEVMVRGR